MYSRFSTTRTTVRPRVLIVEDHADGREALRLLLTIQGYDVEVAGDGMEAVRKALEKPPTAAIIDIVLPNLDGREVAGLLRAALGESVVLIAYSSYEAEELGWRFEDTKFDSWLVKPADPAKLHRCLASGPRPTGEGLSRVRFAHAPPP